jgi:sporulation related protein
MITVRIGSAAIGLCLVLLMAGCSREQQDWRSAEAADSIDSYGQFIQRHPESELVTQARARVAQLGEDRDWQRAGSADTVEAYREFVSQHPSGKWAQEANIRIQNFSLGEQAGTDAASKAGTGARGAPPSAAAAAAGGSAASAGSAARSGSSTAGAGGAGPSSLGGAGGARSYGLAQPGEAAAVPARPGAAGQVVASPVPAAKPRVMAAPGGTLDLDPATASRVEVVPTPSSGSAAPIVLKGYGIQLGAFSSEASASAQWRTLSAKYASQLQGLRQQVVPADTASGRVYRLQAAVGDESRARAICVQLRTYGQGCVAVLPH